MTIALACPATRELERLALGQLPEAEEEQLSQHILACSTCAGLLDSLQGAHPLAAELRALGALLPAVASADALVERLIRPDHAGAHIPSAATDTSDVPCNQPPPERLGRYQIIDRLGAGAMGVVYRGHDPQLGRDVAIKLPNFCGSEAERAAARQRFLREARAAAAIRHSHVCPIYDVGEEQGRPYVVMALVEGETLADRLRRQGRFENPREAVDVVLRIADALAAIHSAGIVHRDLKPANILLDRAGEPLLTDFGLARSDDNEHLTAVGQLVGTPAYMSPEQVSPDLGPVGPWSDQYSLGVVLYEMLTGRRPFEGSLSALIYQLGAKMEPPPSKFRSGLDAKLDAICLQALAKKPAERFAGVQDFINAIKGYFDGAGESSGLDAGPDSPPRGNARIPQRSAASAETQRLYLAARYYLEKRNEQAHRQSIGTYYQILDLDPTFAPAWAGLAFAYHLLSVRGYASPANACPKAKGAALRALALDRSLGEAHSVLATILLEYDWDFATAEQTFQRALELKPGDAATHQLYGKCLACLGRHSEAIAALRRAVDLDPFSPIMSTSLGRHGFLLARRYDQAVLQYQKTLEIDPNFWLAHRFLGWAYLLLGRKAEAVAELVTARRLTDDSVTLASLGHAYAAAGQHAEAVGVLDALTELARQRYVSPDCQAIVHIGLADNDQAFFWLAKAVEDRSEWLCKIRVDPVLDPLRTDPRFDGLIDRMSIKS